MIQTAIFAHRGFSSQYPENTIAAFQAATEVGADGIELDVQLSKDRVPIVIHDHMLERTTNGSGRVSSYTVEKLKQFEAGTGKWKNEKIPTLEDVFIWAEGNTLKVNIEIKSNVAKKRTLWKRILKLIEKYKMEQRVIISSFDHRLIRRVKEKASHLEVAIITLATLKHPEEDIAFAGAEGYHFHYLSLDEEEIKYLLTKKIKLRPYTINDKLVMKQYMKLGCHAFITDDPKLALEVRNEFKRKAADF
ncbi:glycerophosphodiester phosphodiesterase family protein [Bacillus solitudinis]|uniref:glycerophosphodiester phosphodiesterase family protein n=1 Tax=Bacillus solitudinis TaxID=2014074 RepID=UPI000C242A9C|nr:glycerophosphodiester phosphodiesterase family protein [Bacillus solitudinis]